MQKLKNKKIATIFVMILILAMTSTLVALPTANAHDPAWTIPTYAYVGCAPNTVGVGQYTLIIMWLDKYPPTAAGTGGDRWHDFKVEITKPDGNNETLGPYTSDSVGTVWAQYIPDQVGNYTVVFSWPGQTLTTGTGTPNSAGIPYVGDIFEGSTSAPTILQVQQEPITEWQEPPLPTDYWTRPIPTANRDWAQLASNWLKGSQFRYTSFQESGQAPDSAHILYTKSIISGGIADETFGATKYGPPDYENYFGSPIVMNGKIYYNTAIWPKYGYYCVDLKTGEQLWCKNGTDNGLNNPFTLSHNAGAGNGGAPALGQAYPLLSFGQLYHYYSTNGEGIETYLWMTVGSTWYMLDANTGNWILTLVNVPGGTSVTDQDGSILLYSYSSSTGKFLVWNVSQSIPPAGPTGSTQQQWRPRVGATIDAVNDTSWTTYGPSTVQGFMEVPWYADDILPRSGYTMNVTGPTGLPGLSRILQDADRVPTIMFFSDMRNLPNFGSSDMFFQAAAVRIDYHVAPYSPMPNKTNTQNDNLGYGVTLLWNKTITKPLSGNLTFSLGPISYEDKVFTVYSKETMQWWGYSLDDGSLLWGPTAPQSAWDMYGGGGFYAYGKLFSGGYGGVLYAHDIKTGKSLWNYTLTNIGDESPYGNYPISLGGVADGKIYIYSTEHSPTQPMWRGSYLRCINATDGTEIWKSLNFVNGMSIADGCIVAGNDYDNRMYVYGKGPSATTVDAPTLAVTAGSSAIIQGTVLDISAGTKQLTQATDFPNGVAAVSDESQEAWMEYIYEQQAKPTNATGVSVSLDAIDPNGNFVHIGDATSDASGNFGYAWTAPNVPGKYTIIATFKGSSSYGSSSAETFAVVSETQATAAPTSTPGTSVADTYFVPAIAGLFVLIIIVLALVVLMMLRKRP